MISIIFIITIAYAACVHLWCVSLLNLKQVSTRLGGTATYISVRCTKTHVDLVERTNNLIWFSKGKGVLIKQQHFLRLLGALHLHGDRIGGKPCGWIKLGPIRRMGLWLTAVEAWLCKPVWPSTKTTLIDRCNCVRLVRIIALSDCVGTYYNVSGYCSVRNLKLDLEGSSKHCLWLYM